MSHLDLYRTFVAVYRAGSVTGGARARHLTQPAVSQQLAALEVLVGAPLFTRTPRGVQATARGQELYAQVFESLDRLERVTRGLRRRSDAVRRVRLGTTPEYLHAHALDRLREVADALTLTFGEARDLHAALEGGALDAAVLPLKPSARGLDARALHTQRYVLIGPPTLPGPPDLAPAALAAWLNGQPWVSYSAERPVTRRFWTQALGARFDAAPRLTVPDLRAVLRAVELGYGLSIVPDFVARAALAGGRVREVVDLTDRVPPETWWLAYRPVDQDRPEIQALASALTDDTPAP